ncbi:tellurite resistance TerB family protein [Aureimonas frigidaquae]|uniref:tellurite resistance TerB family protein n=1 Tax=Aureimonas frigidaquae TaxID=424757 RepID=UPI0007821967|nr:TerB family tellurite resistance protein [Aureimonas frigidaquae]
MLERLKEFLDGLAPDTRPHGTLDDDPRVAMAALLSHIASADGAVTDAEAVRLQDLVAERFGIDRQDAGRLVDAGRRADEEAVDLYTFTSVLMRHYDEEARLRFVRALWEISLADGHVGELEDNLIWRISELLGVSTRQRVEARQDAAERIRGHA